MTDWQPPTDELKSQVIKSLRMLRSRDSFTRNITPRGLRERIKAELRDEIDALEHDDPDNWYFEINPNWPLKLRDDEERNLSFNGEDAIALVGGDLRVDDGEISRSTFNLCLVLREGANSHGDRLPPCCLDDYSDEWRVVRRFVFDYNSGDRSNPQAPTSHMEFGRVFEPGYTHMEPHYCIDHKILKPRIPFPPTDFVILLDMLIDQYDNLQVIRDENWNSQVVTSESMFWGKYHEKVASYFGGMTDSSRLFEFLGDPDEF